MNEEMLSMYFDIGNGIIGDKMANNKISCDLYNLCQKLGENLKPFGVFMTEGDNLDLLNLKIEDKELWCCLLDFYSNCLGVQLNYTDTALIKAVAFDFFLRCFTCYCEINSQSTQKVYGSVEKFSTISGKYLSCKNGILVSKFLGMNTQLCEDKYSANFDISLEDLNNCEIPYIKMQYTPEPKVVKCNKNMRVRTATIVPIPLLEAWLKGFGRALSKNLVEITYLKDNGEERRIITTVNIDILSKFYDREYARNMLNSSIAGEVNGSMNSLPFAGKVDRGWIKLPEVGSSIIDDTGVRSVNFARIKSCKIVDESAVDKTFINVSLDNVIEEFEKVLNVLQGQNDASKIYRIYTELLRKKCSSLIKLPVTQYNSMNEVVGVIRKAIHESSYAGTVFKRNLHMVMVSSPDVFVNYTGTSKKSNKPVTFGVAELDF